ncbi:MAG: SPASM domain-containing protein [Taibaiella sp.]|nr:SPASM domain-containing protein [Taibaiella sp.]
MATCHLNFIVFFVTFIISLFTHNHLIFLYVPKFNIIRYISEGRGSYDKIVDNIKLVISHKLSVQARVNCSYATMLKIDEVLDDFADINDAERDYLQFDFHKVWQETEKIEDKMFETATLFHNNRFLVSGFTNVANTYTPSSCYADKRFQVTINYNGEVFKCTARDFKDNTGVGFVANGGSVIWNEKHEQRLNIKFNNAPCKECKIFPICGGGCSQVALESNGSDYCVLGFDESLKTKLVENKFASFINT